MIEENEEMKEIKKNPKTKKKNKKKKRKNSSEGESEKSEIKEDQKDPKQEEKSSSKVLYNQRFEIHTSMLVGRGSFGEIYIAYDILNRNYCALKLESQKNKHPQLKNEKMVIETMSECDGFPKFLEFGTQNEYNYLAMEILGPNLSDLFEYCHKFSLQTVLLIAIQSLNRLQELHAKNYIHRDIKPENFLIGVEVRTNTVFMIDFGLSKKYKDPKTMDHIPYRENRPLTGTARYASINTHLGIEQSRRDDLEAIGYVLIFFMKKRLPWQGCHGSNKQDKYNKILEKKLSIPTEILCKDLPLEFSIYLNYVKNIRFDERPDYNFLKGLFIDLLFQHYTEKFLFDWTLPGPQEPPNRKKNEGEVSGTRKEEGLKNERKNDSTKKFKSAFDSVKLLIEENPGKNTNENDTKIDIGTKGTRLKLNLNDSNNLIKEQSFSERFESEGGYQKTDKNANFDVNEFASMVNQFETNNLLNTPDLEINDNSLKNQRLLDLGSSRNLKNLKKEPVMEFKNEKFS